ncbi:UDP-glucose--hexose-1-phosphate uridylyltransferase [Fundicoccus culcitae]|uniref:Galactose-1-phosphate uridylyltransferase n=1 Tax=Fundicoccus culcitae TaxID=2969821 RepID=A0ABY5P9K1_9LACT|nr:UDP-glucose--hexose-1-phosphate uridylyltransferase [Fundicoccus culcitae]UUX35439.1 UDP-glucose--hexose-1-phosphate uridylyltransferase [Fundicoccus culcitae]
MPISQTIQQFVDLAIAENKLPALDKIYVTNRLLALLHLSDYAPTEQRQNAYSLLELMDLMIAYAIEQKIIEDALSEKEQMEAAIMDLLTPTPSHLNEIFWQTYQKSPIEATDYFYALSQNNDYIKTRNIARNIGFTTSSKYGDLEITINLSKPEKDPKEIAKARHIVSSNYPQCALCMENEGYQGRINHPARQNHRIIRFDLEGEVYGLQYSPYVYYNEHSIFLNERHIPMKVDRKCFNNLLSIVEIFPHYFVGSNADLPIVGGSILSHDHYQGGHYTFPMEKAQPYASTKLTAFPTIEVELVHWPLSVIRLRSANKHELVEASDIILKHWRQYSDASLDILAYSQDVPHNTITPIARNKGDQFEMDLVLRNNRTTTEFPDGIFHPHQDVQHIKKENIGLIEVMGLAILPPRLVEELATIEQYILDNATLDEVAPIHQEWAKSLKEEWILANENSGLTVDQFIKAGVGQKFERVLEDAGVFKLDASGRAGLYRFIESVNSL